VRTSVGRFNIPSSIGDVLKPVLLGKPLASERLASERLPNPVARGALSPDAISSTAYGPEQIMIEFRSLGSPTSAIVCHSVVFEGRIRRERSRRSRTAAVCISVSAGLADEALVGVGELGSVAPLRAHVTTLGMSIRAPRPAGGTAHARRRARALLHWST
jgi:hypothetical protein